LISQSSITQHPDSLSNYADGFHTYGVRWKPGKITWYVDDTAVRVLEDETVAYKVMYVIANLTVGGTLTTPSLTLQYS
jgi:beta-glucanase (GH16 family)